MALVSEPMCHLSDVLTSALEPSDLMNKHAWLFRDTWVEESADEIEDIETIDVQKRDERIQKMRVDAMREIHDQRGLPALLELAERGYREPPRDQECCRPTQNSAVQGK